MILYGSPASPFVRKVSIVIEQLGLQQRVKIERPIAHPTQVDNSYYQQNPLGKVPALKLESGMLLHDSLVICDYLGALCGADIIIGEAEKRAAQLTRHNIANGATEAALSLRYETVVRPEQLRWPDWIDGQWHKVAQAINWFEKNPPAKVHLKSIDDIALACLLGYLDFRFAKFAWREQVPELALWFEKVSLTTVMINSQPSD
ncbi:hypothetical protein A9R01_15405 ['Osedax' symbiont bacterium Rs2_46_30_T18]|nr:hypothetical protein A9R01_15405 ['Osedax' symbiont bacterium Rs2_46_30_T18]